MVLLCALVPRMARGAEPPRAATPAPSETPADLFRKGLAEYDARQYRTAIDIFSRIYEQTHAAALLFNIAQSWRLLGDCPKAVAMYDAFLVADPSSPDADRAQAWLTKLRPCRDTTAATVPDARDGAAARTLRANDVEPATRVVLPVAPPPSAPKSPVRSMVVGALGGASLVLAGASGYMAWRANDLSGQLSASYSRGGTWNAQAAALESDGKRAQTEAIILVSTAIVAGVAAYIIHRLSN